MTRFWLSDASNVKSPAPSPDDAGGSGARVPVGVIEVAGGTAAAPAALTDATDDLVG
jgi:hypothetical protein